jgi:hypothetical protein
MVYVNVGGNGDESADKSVYGFASGQGKPGVREAAQAFNTQVRKRAAHTQALEKVRPASSKFEEITSAYP